MRAAGLVRVHPCVQLLLLVVCSLCVCVRVWVWVRVRVALGGVLVRVVAAVRVAVRAAVRMLPAVVRRVLGHVRGQGPVLGPVLGPVRVTLLTVLPAPQLRRLGRQPLDLLGQHDVPGLEVDDGLNDRRGTALQAQCYGLNDRRGTVLYLQVGRRGTPWLNGSGVAWHGVAWRGAAWRGAARRGPPPTHPFLPKQMRGKPGRRRNSGEGARRGGWHGLACLPFRGRCVCYSFARGTICGTGVCPHAAVS